MAETLSRTEYPPLVLRTRPAIEMSDREFFEFCQINGDWRIERTARGDVEIMPPSGGEASNRNAIITAQLTTWALRDGTGAAFDSSGGFILPNGAIRSPDAAWVRRSRLTVLTAEQKERFLPLCPDFVIEVRSPSDSLALTQEKMHEYIGNGATLGWLLDMPAKRAYLYRPDNPVAQLDAPLSLSGEPELPGFTLDLTGIWELDF